MEYKTIYELLQHRAEEQPERVYFYDLLTNVPYTYRELQQMVSETCQKLMNAGIQEGDKVAILLPNSIDFFVLFFAITLCRAVIIPTNIHYGESELKYIIRDADVKAILCKSEKTASNRNVEIKSSDVVYGDTKLLTIERGEEKETYALLPEDITMIMYTSGSTGNSKGVMLTHNNILNGMKNVCVAHKLSEDDKCLCILPWFHVNGLIFTMLAPLYANHPIVNAGKYNKRLFWEQIEDNAITWFSAVPSIYVQINESEPQTHKSLRFARSASSSLSPSTLQQFEEKFKTTVIEAYGATEGGGQLTSNPVPPEEQRVSSVGLPVGVEMKIVNDEGRTCKIGEQGEVWFKGESVSKGYYRKDEETNATFIDGWFHSGDVGYTDQDGYLYLTGRLKELINRESEKISPKEIDDVLYQIPGVKMAATVGVPDESVGEEVVAYCVLESGANNTEIEIKSYCRKRMADFKVPKKVIFVDELPLGPNGKVQRLKLIDWYAKKRK